MKTSRSNPAKPAKPASPSALRATRQRAANQPNPAGDHVAEFPPGTATHEGYPQQPASLAHSGTTDSAAPGTGTGKSAGKGSKVPPAGAKGSTLAARLAAGADAASAGLKGKNLSTSASGRALEAATALLREAAAELGGG